MNDEEIMQNDDLFWWHHQDQEQQWHENMEYLKNMLLFKKSMGLPRAAESTLETAKQLGLKSDFEKYLRDTNGN